MASKRRKRKTSSALRSRSARKARHPKRSSHANAPATWQTIAAMSPSDQAMYVRAQRAEEADQADQAIELYEQILSRNPDSIPTLNSLGLLYTARSRFDEAVDRFTQALQQCPEDPILSFNKAMVLDKTGKWAEAAKLYQVAYDGAPTKMGSLLLKLACAMGRAGRLSEALDMVEEFASDMPPAKGHRLRAEFFAKLGRSESAAEAYQAVIDADPECIDAYLGLSQALQHQKKMAEAQRVLEQARQARPNDGRVLNDLAMIKSFTGDVSESIALFRDVVRLMPDAPPLRSNFLLFSNYVDDISPEESAAEHRKYGQIVTDPKKMVREHSNDPDPQRRLRVGFVSGDYKSHSVAFFFEPLLDGMDRSAIEMVGYGQVTNPDYTSERLARKFDVYRRTVGLSDEEMLHRILEDRIDILVDLSGHTSSNRLQVLALKPAPIQVSWLGYPNTTGMDQVDYYITDEVAGGVDLEHLFTEKLMRLPRGFHCFRAPVKTPEVAPLPALSRGQITFGCFNRERKIRPATICLWARILQATPNSRLLIKGGSVEPQAAQCLHQRLLDNGIADDRLELAPWQPSRTGHLELYNQMDITLDCYPYNGTTTTCESLWMGVPVVTRMGRPYCSRVGASLLRQVGLEFFATTSDEEYVAKAVALASKPEALATIRQTLRARMQSSWLRDEAGFARQFEQALRQMWTTWCATKGARTEASA